MPRSTAFLPYLFFICDTATRISCSRSSFSKSSNSDQFLRTLLNLFLLSEYYSANECYETYYTYDSQSCHFVFLLFVSFFAVSIIYHVFTGFSTDNFTDLCSLSNSFALYCSIYNTLRQNCSFCTKKPTPAFSRDRLVNYSFRSKSSYSYNAVDSLDSLDVSCALNVEHIWYKRKDGSKQNPGSSEWR